MRERIKSFLESIKADYYDPTPTSHAFTLFWDYNVEAEPEYMKHFKTQQDAVRDFAKENGIRLVEDTFSYTKYILLYI